MHIKACIFDLDGTILDTLDDLTNSVNLALHTCQLPLRSREEVRRFVGNGVRKLMSRAVPTDCAIEREEEAYRHFLNIYAVEKAHYTKPYSHIVEAINILTAHGLRCAVLSNKNDEAVKALCDLYFPDVFEQAQGISETVIAKPHPSGLLKLCQELGINIENTIYIGDSEVDIATGAAAGMEVLSVTWGFRSEEVLLQAGATTLVRSPQEMVAYILNK